MDDNGMILPGLRLDIAYATGFVVETGIYCVYACLFAAAFPGMSRATRLRDSRNAKSAWVFLITSVLMYLVATIHLVFGGFRFYKSTFSEIDPNGAISYLENPNHWEVLGLLILICIQTWFGDALAIYRCYFVWENNLWLITVPIGLLLCSIGINIYVLYWIRHPSIIAVALGTRLFNSVYPLAFVQNFMTTSLIVLKIFLRHQESKNAGVRDVGSKLSLIHIIRMVVESAAIYTIQILVLNILYFFGDNFQFVVQSAIIPSIGITFVLLALRIEASRHESTTTKSDFGIRSSMIPRWLHESDHEISSEDIQNDTSLSAGDCTAMTDQRLAAHGKSGTESINCESEFSSNSAIASGPKADTSSLLSSKTNSTRTSRLPV